MTEHMPYNEPGDSGAIDRISTPVAELQHLMMLYHAKGKRKEAQEIFQVIDRLKQGKTSQSNEQ